MSAQRQKASKVCPVFGEKPAPSEGGASDQRQKASKVCPDSCDTGRTAASRRAINAKRHQRYVQVFSLLFSTRQEGVFNAKRHQRYVQIIVYAITLLVQAWCSTPKGIKGMSSGVTSHLPPPSIPCSTPKGIKGMSRRLASIEPGQGVGDQRQKASKVCPG